jgi:hypothetical protein
MSSWLEYFKLSFISLFDPLNSALKIQLVQFNSQLFGLSPLFIIICKFSYFIKVSTKSNLTANELMNAVEHFANQDHSESEMVVIAIMSHGVNGGFIQVKL